MLREDGRRELCCGVVAAVALSLHEWQALDKAQRVPGDLAQHADLVFIGQ